MLNVILFQDLSRMHMNKNIDRQLKCIKTEMYLLTLTVNQSDACDYY